MNSVTHLRLAFPCINFSFFRFILLAITIFLICFCRGTIFSQTDGDFALEVEKPIERELKGGEVQGYELKLSAGQFLRVTAAERGIDVLLRVINPDGVKLVEVDTPNNSNPEVLLCLSETDGVHRIEVVSPNEKADSGKYVLKLVELREGTEDDMHFGAAQKILREANSVLSDGKPDSTNRAKDKIESAAAQYELIKNNLQLKADGFLIIAKMLRAHGASEQSLTYYDRAASAYEAAGLKSEAAITIGASALMSPSMIGYIRRYEKVRSLAKEIGSRRFEIGSMIQIGNGYYWMGDFPNSLEILHEALKMSQEDNSKWYIGMIYGVLGGIYLTLSDFAKAMDYNLKALEVFKSMSRNNNIGWVLLGIGQIYLALGNDRLALEKLQTALSEAQRSGDPIHTAFSLGEIGEIYSRLGEFDKALEYFLKAETILTINNPISLFIIYSKIADLYRKTGRYKEALEYMEKALERNRNNGSTAINIELFITVSKIYLEQGDFPKAFEFANRAISIANSINYSNNLWAAQFLAAQSQLKLGRKSESRRLLEDSVSEIEKLRTRITNDDENSRRFFEDKSKPAQMLIELQLAAGNTTEAFALAEQIKARTLLDLLKNGKVDISKVLTAKEKETEQSFKSEMISLNSQITKENDEIKSKALKTQLDKKRIEYEDMRASLYAMHPELKVQRGEVKPISLEETADLLPDNKSAVVEYVVAEDKTFLFVLTKDASQKVSLKVFPIEIKQKDLAERTEDLRGKLAKGDLDFAKQASNLYDLLLKPAEAEIKNKTNLIIVPDSSLWDLPFQTLQTAQNKYLIETIAISYAPSLTALSEMAKKNKNKKFSGATLLAFGNPTVGKTTSERIQQVFMDEKLDPLPEAERLVTKLEKLYGKDQSRVFIGAQAREETAKKCHFKKNRPQSSVFGVENL